MLEEILFLKYNFKANDRSFVCLNINNLFFY